MVEPVVVVVEPDEATPGLAAVDTVGTVRVDAADSTDGTVVQEWLGTTPTRSPGLAAVTTSTPGSAA